MKDDFGGIPYDVRSSSIKEQIKHMSDRIEICKCAKAQRLIFRAVGIGALVPNKEEYFPMEDPYLFSRYVAPKLNISKLFVGDEEDLIMQEYYALIAEVCSYAGIDFIQVSKLRTKDDRVIRASLVRELWNKEGLEKCKPYIPNITYQYLLKHSEKCCLKM